MIRWCLVVLLSLSPALGVACSPQDRRGRMEVPLERPIEGLPNASPVGDGMLFGGQPTRDALVQLAARGYRTVVNTRGESELDWNEAALVDSLGMEYVSIPMPNPVEGIRDDWVERFDAVMRESGRPMVLHCSSGNRVAGLWAVWLAEKAGVPRDSALVRGAEAGMTRIQPVVEARLARN